jgi:tetratricopeptide (TPR) repeat protein
LAVLLGTTATRCASCVDRTVNREAVRHNNMGIDYLNAGQCVQAEERFRLALEYGPNFEQPHNGLGMVALLCRKDLEQAAQHFKDAIAVNPDFAEAHNNLGTTFFQRNPPKYAEACDEFQAAIEIDPAYEDARENLGMCLMREGTIRGDQGDLDTRRERFERARSHLIRLLEMAPNNFNARHHLGLMDLLEERYASSEQNFKRCLEIDPENPMCSFNLGNLYLRTARCDDAIPQFIAAIRDPNEAGVAMAARQNLGVAYEECAKKDGAIRVFLDKIKSDPGNPTHHYDLGKIYMREGLTDQAAHEWENTVKLDPMYCPAYFDLAMHANDSFDTARTTERCRDFVSCAAETNREREAPRWPEEVEKCKALVKKLEME